ncbi:MAG: hypothetical protein R2851_28280 [Caldilineaceae bacterium]
MRLVERQQVRRNQVDAGRAAAGQQGHEVRAVDGMVAPKDGETGIGVQRHKGAEGAIVADGEGRHQRQHNQPRTDQPRQRAQTQTCGHRLLRGRFHRIRVVAHRHIPPEPDEEKRQEEDEDLAQQHSHACGHP